MLDWVEVYKRLLHLYNVKTQGELGMAMGVPGKIADEDVEESGISWKILDRAVTDKNLSWDWLLAGTGEKYPAPPKKSEPADSPPPKPSTERPPQMETRELERQLLRDGDARRRSPRPPNAAARELEDIKSNMLREIDKVDELLGS